MSTYQKMYCNFVDLANSQIPPCTNVPTLFIISVFSKILYSLNFFLYCFLTPKCKLKLNEPTRADAFIKRVILEYLCVWCAVQSSDKEKHIISVLVGRKSTTVGASG